ncbi:hypothetical protein GQ53DRAFT_748954 [Thozetella sp. PMI_491]|nr:hypothetical protein GQ53DRAFT_748954 [Thozetella sp. PMI_491]
MKTLDSRGGHEVSVCWTASTEKTVSTCVPATCTLQAERQVCFGSPWGGHPIGS